MGIGLFVTASNWGAMRHKNANGTSGLNGMDYFIKTAERCSRIVLFAKHSLIETLLVNWFISPYN
jgi:hypothetical protein